MGTTEEIVELFEREMSELPGDSTHAKYEAFYLFHRNAYHCSSRKTARTVGPSWGALQSKELFALKWKTLSLRRDISLQTDVIEALNYDIAMVPTSNERVNRERAAIYPRYEPFIAAASQYRVTKEDDIAREYREAAVERRRRSFWNGPAPDGASAELNARYERDFQSWTLSALGDLVSRYKVLSQLEAERLMAYMGLGSSSLSAGSTPVRAQVIANKVLSAWYECQMVSEFSQE